MQMFHLIASNMHDAQLGLLRCMQRKEKFFFSPADLIVMVVQFFFFLT